MFDRHCVTTVGKLFTPAVPSWAEGWLKQLTSGVAGTFVATLGKSFVCVISGLLSLSSLITGKWIYTNFSFIIS